jgi:hypothetical protein
MAAALALCAAPLAVSGCATLFGRPADERQITVDLGVSRSEAVRRTLAAFRAQGYELRETLTGGLEPETKPFRQGDDAEAVFRAVVSGSERGARVVLTGTYRRIQLRGAVRGREQEVHLSDDPVERALWNRLHNLGLDIRRSPP